MEVRITKLRVAMAALFVLAGVGLASLLSPLVGTALANVGQVVNISDHSASAFFAKVSSDGKLAVGDGAGPLSVDGTVAARPAAPASPWRVEPAHPRTAATSSPGRARRRSTSPACPSRPTPQAATASRVIVYGAPRAEQRHGLHRRVWARRSLGASAIWATA